MFTPNHLVIRPHFLERLVMGCGNLPDEWTDQPNKMSLHCKGILFGIDDDTHNHFRYSNIVNTAAIGY
jgi:hypothetical protein